MNIGNSTESFSNEMQLLNFSYNTMKSYKNCIISFLTKASVKYTEPTKINQEAIKGFLLWVQRHSSVAYQKQMTSSIKFFYKNVIKQPCKLDDIHYPKYEQKLPEVLSVNEIQRLLNAAKSNLKHQSIISLLYSCGLRLSEVLNLKIEDIDSERMIVRILNSKGNKSRQVNLDTNVLELLRKYFAAYRPKIYLFNGQDDNLQYSATSIRKFLTKYQQKAGIKKHIHPHKLRHNFAVHSLENGTDLRYIQIFLGHQNISTTTLYTHVANLNLSKIKSPIANLTL